MATEKRTAGLFDLRFIIGGQENARQYLKDNPAIAVQLEAAIREKLVPVVIDSPRALEKQQDDAAEA